MEAVKEKRSQLPWHASANVVPCANLLQKAGSLSLGNPRLQHRSLQQVALSMGSILRPVCRVSAAAVVEKS